MKQIDIDYILKTDEKIESEYDRITRLSNLLIVTATKVNQLIIEVNKLKK